MRILVVTPHPPAFPGSGSPARVFCCIRELSRRHEISLMLGTSWGGPVDLEALRPLCQRIAVLSPAPHVPRGGVWTRRLRRWRRDLFGPPHSVRDVLRLRPALVEALQSWRDASFDVVHVHHSITVPLVEGVGLDAPLLVDLHNLMFHYYQRAQACDVPPRERFELALQARKTAAFEHRLLRGPAYFVTTSEVDAQRVHQIHPAARMRVVPNGVDTDYFVPQSEGETERLLFLGILSYLPNIDAVKYFVGDILPLIRRARPNVRLDVVGMDPPDEIRALTDAHVEVVGAVPDVRPYASRAAIHVVPLRAGSGTRLKILEALSMERAVVSTTVGAEGLDVEDGVHLMRADTPEDFARKIVALMDDEALRKRQGAQGRQLVMARYDWKVVATELDLAYHEAARCSE